MPLTFPTNQYQGINAHLNSYLQNTYSAWQSFHGQHINVIADLLDAQLPQGYYATSEESLQLRESSLRLYQPEPDVVVFAKPQPESVSPLMPSSTPTLTKPLTSLMELAEEDYQQAVVIYEHGDKTPVAWLELLSPTNKPTRSGYDSYWEKRNTILKNGIPLLEVDYLHQLPPISPTLPSYPRREPDSQPYMVIINDPRPTVSDGIAQIYLFGIDVPLPMLPIPLLGKTTLPFDLNETYQQTFARRRNHADHADYEQLPLKFETYSPTDQAKIRAKMDMIAAQISPR